MCDAETDDPFAEDSDDPDAPELPWGIKKQCVREAPLTNTERPRIGDEVSVHFVVKLLDGTQIGSTRDGDKPKPFVFVLGAEPRDIILGMELAVQTMKQDEIARFIIASRFAYDDLGSPPLVPPDATLKFEVELLSFVSKYDLFGDGRAVKTVQRRGVGECNPKKGQDILLSLKIIGRNDKILEEHESMEHTVGSPGFGANWRIITEALTHMVEGEEATLALRRFHTNDTLVDRKYGGATVYITLLRVFESEDISHTGNKTLVKKVLVKGKGDAYPKEASRVRLLVESATDGIEAFPSFCGPQVIDFVVGNGDACDALEFAVAEMKLGERAALNCRHPMQVCEPKLGLAGVQAPHMLVTVELQGIDVPIDGSIAMATSPLAHRLSFAAARRSVGAELFKKQRFGLALERYNRILALFDPSEKDPSVQELRYACELNRAACLLQIGNPSEAKAACDKVLSYDPNHVKALYRHASAHFDLSEYSAALKDLSKLLKLDPKNAEARGLAVKVKEAQKHYAKDAKTTAALMIQAETPQDIVDVPESAPTKRDENAATRKPHFLSIFACIPGMCCSKI